MAPLISVLVHGQARGTEKPRVRTRPPGWFAVGTIDLGFKFARPRFQTGYGFAQYQWVGIEANPVLSDLALGAYAGLRLSSPLAELRLGSRVVRSTEHSFLPPSDSYTRELAELIVDDNKASYWAHRVQGKLRIPWWGGVLQPEIESIFFQGVPDNLYVFAETLGVVSAGKVVIRSRLTYRYAVSSVQSLKLGMAMEHVLLPERNASVWRAGPVARFQPYDNLGFRFSFLPTISSPDPLGLIGSEFEFGIRWLWFHEQ